MPHVNIFSVLLLLFIVLKVTAISPVAAWSWWWVMSPLWIPVAAFVVAVYAVVIFASIWGWSSRRRKMAEFMD